MIVAIRLRFYFDTALQVKGMICSFLTAGVLLNNFYKNIAQ